MMNQQEIKDKLEKNKARLKTAQVRVKSKLYLFMIIIANLCGNGLIVWGFILLKQEYYEMIGMLVIIYGLIASFLATIVSSVIILLRCLSIRKTNRLKIETLELEQQLLCDSNDAVQIAQLLIRYQNLLDEGIISQKEFDQKKQSLYQ